MGERAEIILSAAGRRGWLAWAEPSAMAITALCSLSKERPGIPPAAQSPAFHDYWRCHWMLGFVSYSWFRTTRTCLR